MVPTIVLLFGYLLSSWKIDRLSENSRKREEELNQEGFTVTLDNARATGSLVTIGGTLYVQMVGDVTLYCEELRTPCVITREMSFPFRENKDCHDQTIEQSSNVLPETKDIAWDDELEKLITEVKRQNPNN